MVSTAREMTGDTRGHLASTPDRVGCELGSRPLRVTPSIYRAPGAALGLRSTEDLAALVEADIEPITPDHPLRLAILPEGHTRSMGEPALAVTVADVIGRRNSPGCAAGRCRRRSWPVDAEGYIAPLALRIETEMLPFDTVCALGISTNHHVDA